MNILHISVNFNLSCGISKYVYNLMKNYKEKKSVNIFFITNGGNALFKLNDINISPHIMKFNTGLRNIFSLLQNIKELKKFCINNNIDVIHSHHRYVELLSVYVAKKIGIKTVTTAHSFVKGYKHFSFKSDKIIVVSNSVKENIKKKFSIADDKLVKIYNCLPSYENTTKTDVEKLKSKINIREGDIVLLFLGRLNKIKGIDLLVEAFRKVKPLYSDIKLLLVGEIPDNSYKQMNVQLTEDIISLEARANVNTFIELCNIIVVPSREDSFPYVMLEAGYFKKPFVGARTGGISEFIDDNVNGFLFEPGNAMDLADKIIFVLDNSQKATSTAEELHRKVKKYCNCEEYYNKLDTVYEELLQE